MGHGSKIRSNHWHFTTARCPIICRTNTKRRPPKSSSLTECWLIRHIAPSKLSLQSSGIKVTHNTNFIRSFGNIIQCNGFSTGEAALLILREEFGEEWASKVKVFFAGDDTTDEDAMRALKGKGMSFRVSKNPEIETYADYRMPSTKSVSMLLQWLEENVL